MEVRLNTAEQGVELLSALSSECDDKIIVHDNIVLSLQEFFDKVDID